MIADGMILQLFEIQKQKSMLFGVQMTNQCCCLINPIPTSLCHVITVYGLIQPIAGRHRGEFHVNNLYVLKYYYAQGVY